MSLVGNLEDLGLGEILQIVNLSHKSGILELSGRDRSGRVCFRSGQIVSATSSVFPEHLGDLLLRAGMVDLDSIRQALDIQKKQGYQQRIGDILVEAFGLDRNSIDAVVRDHIERVVCQFFSWEKGAFSFDLCETSELESVNMDPLQFMLSSGLNTQWVALEGSRRIDEERQRGELTRAEGKPTVSTGHPLTATVTHDQVGQSSTAVAEDHKLFTSAPMCRHNFLVVVDDPLTAEHIARGLQVRHAVVRVFTSGPGFLAAIRQADPATTIVLVDLDLPANTEIQGGRDLLKDIHAIHPDFLVLVMTEHPNLAREEEFKRLGAAALLAKPGTQMLGAEHGSNELNALIAALCSPAIQVERSESSRHQAVNLGVELSRELDEDFEFVPRQSNPSPGLNLLREMLEELNNPSLGGGSILLILRFASELMNRAVIFQVKDSEITGLGQFGIDVCDGCADERVRSTRIPVNAESLFRAAIASKMPTKVSPVDCQWDNYFLEQLGGQRPQEAFVGPLVSEDRVVAVLYGDNMPATKTLGDTETLEIFLSRAGPAMGKALLEWRVQGKSVH